MLNYIKTEIKDIQESTQHSPPISPKVFLQTESRLKLLDELPKKISRESKSVIYEKTGAILGYYMQESDIQRTTEESMYLQLYNLTLSKSKKMNDTLKLMDTTKDPDRFRYLNWNEYNIFEANMDIHILCHSHMDPGWIKTYKGYFTSSE